MHKKDYIIKVLDAVMDYRPLARGLKILIEGDALDDNTIDSIVNIFANSIKEINDSETKDKLIKSQSALEKIKSIEREQHLHDKKELSELDDMIQNI